MFLLISIVLVSFTVGSYVILKYAFRIYNNEIYRQSALALSISSTSIEHELKKLEQLSYQVSTDQLVQKYLFDLKQSRDEYAKFSIGTDLKNRMVQLGALNKYVKSIHIYDVVEDDYKVGNQVMIIPEDWVKEIKAKALEKQGGVQWIVQEQYDQSLIITRDIRYYIQMSLEHLGVIIVRIDMDKIISDIMGNLEDGQTLLFIMNEEDELIYATNDAIPFESIQKGTKKNKGYHLLNIEDDQYFATYTPSRDLDWTYTIISPYSTLFQALIKTSQAVGIIYAFLFILALYIGIKFVSNITKPIESLNRKMKRVQTGELDPFKKDAQINFSKDELGEMHENFQMMMNQINTLIKENFQKQIAIKDAEYKALQAQINPHFLYNTLESINWTAKVNGQTKISEIAESLAFLLRKSIDTKGPLIPLKEEIKIIHSYITIQSYRFEERLKFSLNIPPEIMDCKIPKFVLQPLIENSIQYGLQQMLGTCTIEVTGELSGDTVLLTVQDNGKGIDRQLLEQLKRTTYESKGTGLGLKNIRERIQLLFGENYGIEIQSKKNHGTTVKIIIPYTK